ncbi:hypothetical protein [Streptomyces sp. NPDC047725]|uniref:hypothetical protein n=1 Tax=Streptomyces sp. NPDC047725 TaxID=3365487 RepID=UPI00371BE0D4
MHKKLEAIGASLLERLVPRTQANAAATGCYMKCLYGMWHMCCTGTGCDRSESPC